MKQLCAVREVGEHGGGGYASASSNVASGLGGASNKFDFFFKLERSRFSFVRVIRQNPRATLIGSIASRFHHVRSSPAWWAAR
jgi:hypothetical protein